MIYISKGHSAGRHDPGNPSEIDIHPTPPPLNKSISMILLNRGTYTALKFIDAVWKHAGFLCIEVVFNHDYETPDGQLSHTYDLYFQWGRFGGFEITNENINAIMWKIERELEATGEFDLRGRSHGSPNAPIPTTSGNPTRVYNIPPPTHCSCGAALVKTERMTLECPNLDQHNELY